VPVTPTYPGVYVEELESAVHTIVGVDTAIAAFIGYTQRGQTNMAVEIFSYGDYERAFGGLDLASPVSYAVQQFFQNGGTHAWVVRVAKNAHAAELVIYQAPVGAQRRVLDLEALSEGAWGNDVRVEVDYDTARPEDLFNLSPTEYAVENGLFVSKTLESLRNLSMDDQSPGWVEDTVKANSKLIKATREPGAQTVSAIANAQGASVSARFTPSTFPFTSLNTNNKFNVTLDGQGPFLATLDTTAIIAATSSAAKTTALAAAVANAAKVAIPTHPTLGASVIGSGGSTRLSITTPSASKGQHSSLIFTDAPQNNAAAIIGLGIANGGIEVSGAAGMRPAATGTLGTYLDETLPTAGVAGLKPTSGDAKVSIQVFYGTATTHQDASLTIIPAALPAPTSIDQVRLLLEGAIQAAAADPANVAISKELIAARVELVGHRFRVIPSGNPEASFAFDNATTTDTTAASLGLTDASGSGIDPGVPNRLVTRNVAAYVLGSPDTLRAQVGGIQLGVDGDVPTTNEFLGDEATKKGLFALEDVDLFNILSIPPTLPPQYDPALVTAAIGYCERRRAFFIVDVPGTVDTLPEAQTWIKATSTPKSPNAAAYFPWVCQPDPLRQYRAYPFPPSGMIAGLYARTDASRGVWKAPAGTEATLRGPQSLVYKLTDAENGTLNPLGLNAIRSMPVYGNIVWGARTLFGADALANEWKYIPVRRIALFIEESVFRGTQWVVFEPNDEPLWAQIRLNVGAFMHTLFTKGAFEHESPRDAYLVKCDSETTTPEDVDRGIVNILVGFAPLRPAEFVIIQITQLAGQVEA
jgi:phage tail sheath protein FI